MKITNQSENELTLSDGKGVNILIGILFMLVGCVLGYYYASAHSVPIWAGIIFGLAGLGITFFSSSITVSINKSNGQLLYQTKRLIGGKTATYQVADILRIETRKQWHTQSTSNSQGISMPRQVLVSQSVIVFKDGRELPLDHQKGASTSMVLMAGQGTEVALATQVAAFLGVPFQEIVPPSMGNIVDSIASAIGKAEGQFGSKNQPQ